MMIRVTQGKGNKDRMTVLSPKVLTDLRSYFKQWQPSDYLFEGNSGKQYSASSVKRILEKAAIKAKINKHVTAHMLRHRFKIYSKDFRSSLK